MLWFSVWVGILSVILFRRVRVEILGYIGRFVIGILHITDLHPNPRYQEGQDSYVPQSLDNSPTRLKQSETNEPSVLSQLGSAVGPHIISTSAYVTTSVFSTAAYLARTIISKSVSVVTNENTQLKDLIVTSEASTIITEKTDTSLKPDRAVDSDPSRFSKQVNPKSSRCTAKLDSTSSLFPLLTQPTIASQISTASNPSASPISSSVASARHLNSPLSPNILPNLTVESKQNPASESSSSVSPTPSLQGPTLLSPTDLREKFLPEATRGRDFTVLLPAGVKPRRKITLLISDGRPVLEIGPELIPIVNVTQIVAGRRKALVAIMPELKLSSSHHFFTIVYQGANGNSSLRTLDLQAPSQQVRDFWVSGLRSILEESRIIISPSAASPSPLSSPSMGLNKKSSISTSNPLQLRSVSPYKSSPPARPPRSPAHRPDTLAAAAIWGNSRDS